MPCFGSNNINIQKGRNFSCYCLITFKSLNEKKNFLVIIANILYLLIHLCLVKPMFWLGLFLNFDEKQISGYIHTCKYIHFYMYIGVHIIHIYICILHYTHIYIHKYIYIIFTYILYICIYIYIIYDSQREKTFLKIFRPDAFFSHLYKTLFIILYI